MKPAVHFATENSFCPTPFYEKKGNRSVLDIESTPYSSPAIIEDDSLDRKAMAGRTPHNKLAETTKNIELFNQNFLLNGSMFKTDLYTYVDSQSPLAYSNEANISVVSPDLATSHQNLTPLSVNSKMMLFGPPTEIKQPKADMDSTDINNNNHVLLNAPKNAEKITFAMPAESENNSRAKKIVATPFFERPKVIKGTPYACKSFTSEASSVDENECPNRSHIQVSPNSSPVWEKALQSSCPSSTNSSLDLEDFYTRSVFKTSPLNASLASQSNSCVTSPAVLFSSPRVSPKQSPSSPLVSSRSGASPTMPDVVDQVISISPPRTVSSEKVNEFVEQQPVTAVALGVPPLAPRDITQLRGAILSSQPTASVLVTPNTSVNSMQMMLGSPAVLNRAGGVAKGRGPVMSALPIQTFPAAPPVAPAVKLVATVQPKKEPEVRKAPVPSHTVVVKSSTATASALLNPAQRKPMVNSLTAASPMGKPLTAHPAARVARKVLTYTPKKGTAIVSTAVVSPVVVELPVIPQPPRVVVAGLPVLKVVEVPSVLKEEAPCVEKIETTHMCNVSIQCSESLLDIVVPVNVKSDRSRSFNTHHYLADTTGISSVGDTSTCSSQMHGDLHHSPMFTSYYRTQHDSDSEVDDMELGLFDLLQGEQADMSTIATQTRSAPVVTPLLINKSVSSHGSGLTTGSKSSLRSISPSSFSSNLSFKSTAGVMGSARRVPLHEQQIAAEVSDSEDEDAYEEEASLASLLSSATSRTHSSPQQPFDTSQCTVGPSMSVRPALNQSTYCNPNHSLSFSMDDAEEWMETDTDMLDETCATDAAVKFTNESIYEHDLQDDEDENVETYPASSSAAVEESDPAETTMTVDQSPLIDMQGMSSSILAPAAARLAFQPMSRAKDAVPDMKEITFSTAPGTFVTVMMDFANKHGRPMHLICQAVPVRFEPTLTLSGDSTSITSAADGGNSYFSVSPSELTILPGEDNQLYIKFNPPKGAAGVYSGVIKVKNGQKNFMLLLRGEAIAEQPKEHKRITESNSTRSESSNAAASTRHKSRPPPVVVEQDNQLHLRQVQLQQRIQLLSNKQASPNAEPSSRSRSSSVSSTATATSSSCSAVVVLSTSTATTHSSFVSSTNNIAPGAIRVSPETAQVHQIGGSGCQFEAFAEVSGSPMAGVQAVTVEVSSSTPLIRLASTQYELTHCNSVVRVRMMLDATSNEFQSFSKRFLSSSGSDSVTYHLGFVTVKCAKREFNIDVILSRGTCRAVEALYRRSTVVEETPVKPTVVESDTYQLTKTLATFSPSATPSTPICSSASIDLTRVDSHRQEEHFGHHHNEYSLNTTHFQSTEVTETKVVQGKSKGRSAKKTESKQILENKSGVYFRRENTQFGAVTIGSLTRTRLELCNGTDREMIVYLGDVALPFVLLHNELSIRPRSYVRVPMRFLPTHAGEFVQELVAQTADGSYHTTVQMRGSAY